VHVTVVGGGITGLAAAYFLKDRADVTLYEASDRVGGKIAALEVAGHRVEAGPDAFIARAPEAVDLCRVLGLGDQLVPPVAHQAGLWNRGQLTSLPPGLVLGVPTDVEAVKPLGITVADDPCVPLEGDASIGEVITTRMGREVLERLVDPLLGGIHAGNSDDLSIDANAPQLAAAARKPGRLADNLKGERPTLTPSEAPVFLTVRDGLTRLVERLVEELGDRIVTGHRVTDFDGPTIDTTPPAGIPYSSVALTVVAYPASAFPEGITKASGFLVPRVDGRLMTACSFGSSKWPHWSDEDTVIVRLSAGRYRDERAMQMDDAALIQQLHEELAEATGLKGEPIDAVVARWPNGFPQYNVGHLDWVAKVESALPSNVKIAGAAYRGVGLPACIAQAKRAADALLAGQ
jgi:protoporphyrinogen/coproporphyrinogen III oxidase